MQLLTLIPALAAIIYAVTVKVRQRKTLDIILFTLGGGVALFNEYFMYEFFTEQGMPVWMRCIQQFIACMIVPTAYMYFASQMGFKWLNGNTVALWMFMLFLALPPGIFLIDGVAPMEMKESLNPMTFHFYREGREIFYMRTADIIIVLQALLTLTRMFVMTITLRRYHLAVSPRVRYFLTWWLAAIVFIIFCAAFTTEEFAEPALLWTYYICYSTLIVSIFILLGQNFDLHPILLSIEHEKDLTDDDIDDEEGETAAKLAGSAVSGAVKPQAEQKDEEASEPIIIENIASFVMHGRVMAEQLRTMLNNKCFCDPNLCLDDVISQLGTNRTYFSRMMKAEFGCTFTELVTNHRIEYAEHLLRNTDLSINEIANQSGFSDNSNFTRRFRKVHGIPPSQFRNM